MDNANKGREFIGKVKRSVFFVAECVQIALAVLIFLGIILKLVTSLGAEVGALTSLNTSSFKHFLEYMIDMVIGVELIHLLCHPNLDNVIDILLVALTREVVLAEIAPVGVFLLILSIAALFAIRKFMFIEKLDSHELEFEDGPFKKHSHKKDSSENKSEE
ncbi:MAG: hypothetical protein Q4B67_04020 [Eubacteriales bacterium]|nr:hypothetical protein [Eubacteriales bacterium]